VERQRFGHPSSIQLSSDSSGCQTLPGTIRRFKKEEGGSAANNPTPRNDLLSGEEDKFFADTCAALAAAGNGFNATYYFKQLAQPGTGPVSIDLVRKVKKRQELATARNVYPIDPA
jgi:hypothetical protein